MGLRVSLDSRAAGESTPVGVALEFVMRRWLISVLLDNINNGFIYFGGMGKVPTRVLYLQF
jgi:hypothetical protein